VVTKSEITTLPPSTPRDVRLGLTSPDDVAYPLRWGIIGAGEISRQWALTSRECAGATMAAVAARDEDKAKAFAAKHGVEKAFGGYAAMLASPDIDIVYIGTIDSLHKEHCLMAIEAGKHVLCEKAMAKNVADAREMYVAANKNNVMLQDGVWSRFLPAVEHARYLMEADEIGDVVMVQADFDPYYTTQAATLAFGAGQKPVRVQVAGRHFGAGGAILEYEGNRFANLSFIAYPSEFPEVTEYIGTRGRITLEQPAHCPTRLTLRVPPHTPSRYADGNKPSPEQHFEFPFPDTINVPDAYPNQEGFIYQTEAVHRCLAAGLRECPQMNQQESLHNLEVLESIHALREGSLDSIPTKPVASFNPNRQQDDQANKDSGLL
jgi:dihydrodiol dehydrogenase / D-xylose 1-dehydrogenase (NADP)